ncbi:MAG: UvrD-helicase domain-containing protein [Deferribacteraceae bacterium]|jgi:DNA helicase-2/ATP-dependent DNA helicase PcrA|nr:UvrD-helicase domain-containing protein [Deferribacteraceae bacterium]
MNYLEELNPSQREAVEHTEGPLLVLAGAGSGKTRVITYRIAYLVNVKKIFPGKILAVTFTNRAAGEMRSRVHSLIGISHYVRAGTFHSTALAFLKRYIQYTPYKNGFSVIEKDDRLSLVRQVIKELNLDSKLFSPKKYMHAISSYKNSMRYIEEGDPSDRDFGERFWDIFDGYSKALLDQRLIDFDDMLAYCLRILLRSPEVLEEYKKSCEYILVDEYQDTNAVQFAFLKILAGANGNLCVVGDDDQSIYAFRGAEISNILNFEKHFENVREIKLTQNYRSTEKILSLANNLIGYNFSRRGKLLKAERSEKGEVTFRNFKSEKEEADFLAEKAYEWYIAGRNLSDMAVLYRTNAQSRNFEIALKRESIPYKVVGGVGFYQRREIKDILSYLRVLGNPFDEISFVRSIKTPPRGVGDQLIDKIKFYAESERVDFLTAASQVAFTAPKRQAMGINLFLNIILTVNSAATITDKVSAAIRETKYQEYLFATEEREEAREREDNILELINAAAGFEEQYPDAPLSDFLAASSLTSSEDEKTVLGAVSLMTIHSAKGLEFDSVYIAGAEEGIFPIGSLRNGETELEEERRLCYVAITRAKTYLTVACAQSRIMHGSRLKMNPSRFIREMREGMLETGIPVFHETFGEGFIIDLGKETPIPIADVMFRRSGRKRIRADFLKIKS